jgi:hypothetical protein
MTKPAFFPILGAEIATTFQHHPPSFLSVIERPLTEHSPALVRASAASAGMDRATSARTKNLWL